MSVEDVFEQRDHAVDLLARILDSRIDESYIDLAIKQFFAQQGMTDTFPTFIDETYDDEWKKFSNEDH